MSKTIFKSNHQQSTISVCCQFNQMKRTFGFGRCCQLGKVFDCSKNGVNVQEIGNVVAEIGHWRFENWRQPDDIDSQFHEVIQTAYNSLEKFKLLLYPSDAEFG